MKVEKDLRETDGVQDERRMEKPEEIPARQFAVADIMCSFGRWLFLWGQGHLQKVREAGLCSFRWRRGLSL